jgi:hypothetical protein
MVVGEDSYGFRGKAIRHRNFFLEVNMHQHVLNPAMVRSLAELIYAIAVLLKAVWPKGFN